jgi:GNAT superfamily N-acetyltransferase
VRLKISIWTREATIEDANAIVVVLRRSISESCALDRSNNAGLIASWLSNKTEEQVIRWVENQSLYLNVTTVNEDIVGVGMATTAGEISLCYVLPDFLRLGVGAAIIKDLESHLRSLGITRCVMTSTVTGLKFYSHMGYEISGKMMSVQGINGIPMRRDLA